MAQTDIFNLLNELERIESFLHYITDSKTKNQAMKYLGSLYEKYNYALSIDGTKPTILVDMDEVLADLLGPWLNMYNQDYDDNLTQDQILNWNIFSFTKPECGKKFYNYLKTPGMFRHLPVRPYAKEMIQGFIDNDFRVLIVSDSPSGYAYCDYIEDNQKICNPADDKRKWLAEHFPMIPSENIVFTSQKWFIKGDVLIDDKPSTYLEFLERNRNAILVDQPFNRDVMTDYRAYDLKEALNKVYDLCRVKQEA